MVHFYRDFTLKVIVQILFFLMSKLHCLLVQAVVYGRSSGSAIELCGFRLLNKTRVCCKTPANLRKRLFVGCKVTVLLTSDEVFWKRSAPCLGYFSTAPGDTAGLWLWKITTVCVYIYIYKVFFKLHGCTLNRLLQATLFISVGQLSN